MSFIEALLNKVKVLFYPPVSNSSKKYLSVFLHRGSDYIFTSRDKEFDPKTINPILLPIDNISVEKGLSEIHEYLFKELEIVPENIEVDYEVLSLNPIIDQTIYFAFVQISDPEYTELIEKNSEKYFISIPLSKISIYEDSNIFFKFLMKMS